MEILDILARILIVIADIFIAVVVAKGVACIYETVKNAISKICFEWMLECLVLPRMRIVAYDGNYKEIRVRFILLFETEINNGG